MATMYSWDEIKAKSDCVDYCQRVLGLSVESRTGEWLRFNCPWRPGSDSGSFAVKPQGWYDHVAKEGGSIIDLVARAKCGGDIWAAQEMLGEQLKLSPSIKAKNARRIVRTYDYLDLSGSLQHQTVRYEPKDFRQRRPDPDNPGSWIWDLGGIEPILYRMADWHRSSWVCVVGGEKDADNLLAIGIPATTNPMGEGNWHARYNERLRGKHVVILPDNDDVGRDHAQQVAAHLRGLTKHIKILPLPDLPPKGDVSDWIEAGGTKDTLIALIKATEPVKIDNLPAPTPEDPAKQKAKDANKSPFKNYRWEEQLDATGSSKNVKVPMHINDLLADLNTRLLGFPRRVGSIMFDHDRRTGAIRFIESAASLQAWIAEKTGHPMMWTYRMEGAVSPEQLYQGIVANCERYEMISGVPNWPTRSDVYYTHDRLPAPTPDASYFKRFCEFFNPASESDETLLRAFIATPLWYKFSVPRPLWIIDSPDGQGSGKTKLVEMVTQLYGGEDVECGQPLWVDWRAMGNETMLDRIIKRLLSATGRKKRVFCLDNVTGYFRSSSLSALLTQGSISGIAPYGKGEETRPNDLTYVITSNSADVDHDIACRAYILWVARPEQRIIHWERDIQLFIRAHRLQIIADIIGMLERGPQFDASPTTRFAPWEHDILQPMAGDAETYSNVFKRTLIRQQHSDGEIEESDTIREYFTTQIANLGFDPEHACLWIQSPVLIRWALEAIPGFGGMHGRNATQKLRNMIKCGMLTEMSATIEKYPFRNGRRGLMWNAQFYKKPDGTSTPDVIRLMDGKIHIER